MFDVGDLVFGVELAEGQQLLGLFDEGLDDRDAGKAFLAEVGEPGEGLLADIPLLHHVAAHHRGGSQQQGRGDQGEGGQQPVHPEHLGQGHTRQQQGVEEHHDAPGEALGDRVQVVGEETHEPAHLVDLVVVLAQMPGVAEHPVSQALLHLEGGAQEHNSPEKAAHHHGGDDR